MLAKRDEEMRQFLDTFDTAKAECLAQKQAAQAEITRLLDQFHKFTEIQLDEDSLVKGNGGEAVLHGVGDWQRKEAEISAGKLTLDQLLIGRV